MIISEQVAVMDDVLSNYVIGMDDFMAFYSILDKISAMRTGLSFMQDVHGSISPESFRKVLHKLTGVQLCPEIVNIVFYLFSNEGGTLNMNAFIEVLTARNRE